MTRVNARLDPELSRKVKYLRERTGKSTTEVVKAALEGYYARVAERATPAELLADFVGCAEGPEDLSTNYKRELIESLSSKHGS